MISITQKDGMKCEIKKRDYVRDIKTQLSYQSKQPYDVLLLFQGNQLLEGSQRLHNTNNLYVKDIRDLLQEHSQELAQKTKEITELQAENGRLKESYSGRENKLQEEFKRQIQDERLRNEDTVKALQRKMADETQQILKGSEAEVQKFSAALKRAEEKNKALESSSYHLQSRNQELTNEGAKLRQELEDLRASSARELETQNKNYQYYLQQLQQNTQLLQYQLMLEQRKASEAEQALSERTLSFQNQIKRLQEHQNTMQQDIQTSEKKLKECQAQAEKSRRDADDKLKQIKVEHDEKIKKLEDKHKNDMCMAQQQYQEMIIRMKKDTEQRSMKDKPDADQNKREDAQLRMELFELQQQKQTLERDVNSLKSSLADTRLSSEKIQKELKSQIEDMQNKNQNLESEKAQQFREIQNQKSKIFEIEDQLAKLENKLVQFDQIRTNLQEERRKNDNLNQKICDLEADHRLGRDRLEGGFQATIIELRKKLSDGEDREAKLKQEIASLTITNQQLTHSIREMDSKLLEQQQEVTNLTNARENVQYLNFRISRLVESACTKYKGKLTFSVERLFQLNEGTNQLHQFANANAGKETRYMLFKILPHMQKLEAKMFHPSDLNFLSCFRTEEVGPITGLLSEGFNADGELDKIQLFKVMNSNQEALKGQTLGLRFQKKAPEENNQTIEGAMSLGIGSLMAQVLLEKFVNALRAKDENLVKDFKNYRFPDQYVLAEQTAERTVLIQYHSAQVLKQSNGKFFRVNGGQNKLKGPDFNPANPFFNAFCFYAQYVSMSQLGISYIQGVDQMLYDPMMLTYDGFLDFVEQGFQEMRTFDSQFRTAKFEVSGRSFLRLLNIPVN